MADKVLIDAKTGKEVILVNKPKKKKSSFNTIMFLLIFVLIIYFNGARIETIMTFPGMGKENLEKHGMEKIYADYSEGQVVGLFLDNNVKDTIIYFHGNGESLNYFYEDMKYLGDLGYNVMAPDYPSYSETDGFPYEDNVYAANQAFFEKVIKERNIKQENIIIFGYSVGSGSAVEFAKNNPNSKALVIMSGFTSRYDMSKKYFGMSVQKIFNLKNSFNNKQKLADIKMPTLIIHGNIDKVVSYYMGEENFEASGSTAKKFIELDNQGHNRIFFSKFGETLDSYLKLFFELKAWKQEKIKLTGDKHLDIQYLINMEDDSSITKFISAKKPFNNKEYVPENLVEITGNILVKQKYSMQLRAQALYNLEKMGEEFYKNFNTKISLVSAYRSYATQKTIKDGGCSDAFCSNPGYSEHQSGLAVDLFEATSEKEFLSKPKLVTYFEWLNNNAYKYGFTNTYQKGLEIDTYAVEPWHWRYVGVELATLLKENDLTIAEYYNLINNNTETKG